MVSTKLPVYAGEDIISGRVDVHTRKRIEHLGLRVELLG